MNLLRFFGFRPAPVPPPHPPLPEPLPLPGDGWMPWIDHRPPHVKLANRETPYMHRAVEIMRREWDEPHTVKPAEMPPWMNVAGLYWRPLP